MTYAEWVEKLCKERPGLREALAAVAKTAEPLPLESRFMVIR